MAEWAAILNVIGGIMEVGRAGVELAIDSDIP